jgi:hypothetical protein
VIPSMLAGLALAQAPEEGTPEGGGQELRRYALLVGHNDGGEGRTPLRYAHEDAEQMAEVLTALGGVAPEHHQLLLDPDRASLDAALESIRASLQSEQGAAEFVFYYSGHSDEEGLLLGEELYGYRELRQSLDGLPARVRIAILDSCASGALILAKGGKRVAPFLVDESSHVGGFAYLTSSSADEVSQEAERIGGSYFTHYLASGLRGAADTSGDGRVTLSEAYSFAHEETLQRTERTQHGPQHAAHEFQLSGTGEYVLTDLGLTSASLVLDESVAGRASVRDVDGNLIVELQKLGGRAIELGLEEGRYTVTVTLDDDQFGEAVVEVALGSSTLVAAGAFAWYDSEATALRGDDPPSAIVAPVTQAPALQERLWRFSVTPDLPPVPPGIDHFTLAMMAGRSEELNGVAFGASSYQVTGHASGIVMAMGATVVGELDGIQTSLGANVAEQGGGGMQASLGVNTAGPFDGAQLTVGMNLAEGGLRGTQLSAIGNVATGGMNGFQGTAGANVASGPSRGMQAAPLFNRADDLNGVQLSLVNIGGDVRGTQIGLVNIARNVSGAQIGLVNIAHDVDGAPLGLFSFEKEGRHDLLLFVSESDIANAELKLGGDYIYTVLGVGYGTHPVPRPEDMSARDWDVDQAHLYNAMGFGVHLPFKKPWLDLDTVMSAYIPLGTTVVGGDRVRGAFSNPPTFVAHARATFGYQLARQFAPFVGASMNVRLPLEYELLDIAPYDGSGEMLAWPGVFGGLQF